MSHIINIDISQIYKKKYQCKAHILLVVGIRIITRKNIY